MAYVVRWDVESGRVLGVHPSMGMADEFAQHGYLVNPDRSGVADVPIHRWRVRDGKLVAVEETAEVVTMHPPPTQEVRDSLLVVLDGIDLPPESSPILSVAWDVLVDSVIEFIPGLGGLPQIWRGPLQEQRLQNIRTVLLELRDAVKDSVGRIASLETKIGMELASSALCRAARAVDAEGLEIARRAFRKVIGPQFNSTSAELARVALQLERIEIAVLQQASYWEASDYDDLRVEFFAESLGADLSIVAHAVDCLAAKGVFRRVGQWGPVADKGQVSITGFGRSLIGFLR